jgi:hypothetical protein
MDSPVVPLEPADLWPQEQQMCAKAAIGCWAVILTMAGGSRLRGAGWIGSKRLDPGAPTTPRPAIAGPAVSDARLPLPPSRHGVAQVVLASIADRIDSFVNLLESGIVELFGTFESVGR